MVFEDDASAGRHFVFEFTVSHEYQRLDRYGRRTGVEILHYPNDMERVLVDAHEFFSDGINESHSFDGTFVNDYIDMSYIMVFRLPQASCH